MPQGNKERKLSSKSYFFNKAKNLQEFAIWPTGIAKYLLEQKYKIVLFDKSQT